MEASSCTGTLKMFDPYIVLLCTEPSGHLGDHYDSVMLTRWSQGAKIGTCHLPPNGTEVWE